MAIKSITDIGDIISNFVGNIVSTPHFLLIGAPEFYDRWLCYYKSPFLRGLPRLSEQSTTYTQSERSSVLQPIFVKSLVGSKISLGNVGLTLVTNIVSKYGPCSRNNHSKNSSIRCTCNCATISRAAIEFLKWMNPPGRCNPRFYDKHCADVWTPVLSSWKT